jgi:hypothetical protein
MKQGTQSVPEASAPVDSDHEGHVRAFRCRIGGRFPGEDAPRRCDVCHGVICCALGQKTVFRSDGEHGVWLLHPRCEVPAMVSETENGSGARG